MSDLIERQSAIDEWKNDFKGYVNSINIPRDDYNGIMEYIDELPSAEPERQTGHWVNNIHDLPICDQCGYMTPYDRSIDDYEYGKYCPNCGSKMEGEQQ